MNSFRQHAACVGANGNFSVMSDVLGFIRGTFPPDPRGTPSVSMREQIDAVAGKHVHLNVVQVGVDALSAAARATALERIDFAILRIREIYRPVSLGVGRVQHWEITQAQANGADDIGGEDEAEDLGDDWSVPNDGIDVFMVRVISTSAFVGISPVDGACEKGDKDDGLLGGTIARNADAVARTFAHEIGHYLGLEHNHGDACPTSAPDMNRLMAQTRCATSNRNSTVLTSGEGSTMRSHCMVHDGC